MAGMCPVGVPGMMLDGYAWPWVWLRGRPGLSVIGPACTGVCVRHVGCVLEESEELGVGRAGRTLPPQGSCCPTWLISLTGTHVGMLPAARHEYV